MNFEWEIDWTNDVKKYYAKSPHKERLQRIILSLKQNPYQGANIKRLTGDLSGFFRYRFSNLRLIYKIDDKAQIITLVYLGTRGDIY